MDPHEVLGVSRDASQDEVRVAYRRLVRIHHPDRHVTEPDEVRRAEAARMAEITGAYTLLNDPVALARYRANRAREGRPPERSSADPSDRARAARRVDDGGFDYRRAAASEFTPDDDPVDGRWGRTPTPSSDRVAAQRSGSSSRPRSRPASTGGRATFTRIVNGLAWFLLVATVAVAALGAWLLATDGGRRVLDDLRGDAAPAMGPVTPHPDDGPAGWPIT